MCDSIMKFKNSLNHWLALSLPHYACVTGLLLISHILASKFNYNFFMINKHVRMWEQITFWAGWYYWCLIDRWAHLINFANSHIDRNSNRMCVWIRRDYRKQIHLHISDNYHIYIHTLTHSLARSLVYTKIQIEVDFLLLLLQTSLNL